MLTFFARMLAIYGEAKFRQVWPADEIKRGAMREWAPQILALSSDTLTNRLTEAKGMMHHKDYQWPDIGRILAGNGASVTAPGQAAASYRPASEALACLPPPSDNRRQRNKARMAKLLESL